MPKVIVHNKTEEVTSPTFPTEMPSPIPLSMNKSCLSTFIENSNPNFSIDKPPRNKTVKNSNCLPFIMD